jgi:hypothetical protein
LFRARGGFVAVAEAVHDEPIVIRTPALLRGPDGIITQCIIETWQEQSSSGKTYTRCRIVDEPADLPNGSYVVQFAEQSLQTNKHYGKWGLFFLPPEIEIVRAA